MLLTDRALADIGRIEAYSIAEWGKRATAKYIADMEVALRHLQEQPTLLHREEQFHPDFRFYRVNKHLLVCDVQPKAIVVLAVVHVSRDNPGRLTELEPTLAAEIGLLHKKLGQRKKR